MYFCCNAALALHITVVWVGQGLLVVAALAAATQGAACPKLFVS